MKIQDVLFLIVFLFLVIHKNPKMMVWAGITCLVLSIPLFSFWIFFTAERLVWYSAAFFLLAIIFNIIYVIKKKEDVEKAIGILGTSKKLSFKPKG